MIRFSHRPDQHDGTPRGHTRVGIVGCGTAGQAAAIFLARAGHQVTVLERSATLKPVGAGLLMQPSGLRILDRLGLLQQIKSLGTPVHRLHGTTSCGRSVLDLSYPRGDDSAHGIGLHRGALFEVMHHAVKEAGVEVRCEWNARTILTDGRQRSVVSASGQVAGPFDLLCIADGARSSIRDTAGIPFQSRQYPWGAWWFVANDPDRRYAGVLRQIYRGTRRMVGFLPSGRVRCASSETVSLFWSVRLDDAARVRDEGVDAWKREVRSLTSHADPILEQITHIDDLITATYFDVTMPKWDDGPLIILGDAGHAMSPQLGQGANLALVDASVLADCLAATSDICVATARFTALRRKNISFYQFASRWLTPIFQSGQEWITPPRDLLMGPLGSIGWCQSQMLGALSGDKQSWRASCGTAAAEPGYTRPHDKEATEG